VHKNIFFVETLQVPYPLAVLLHFLNIFKMHNHNKNNTEEVWGLYSFVLMFLSHYGFRKIRVQAEHSAQCMAYKPVIKVKKKPHHT
jgi:hypothetical protein